VQELDKKLKELQKQVGVGSEQMTSVRRLITNYKSANKSKKFLHEEMDEYNRQFFVALRENYPSLSKTELNLAVFLRLKLSSKEISAFMNVEPKTINVYKYRMKQKMGLPKGVSVEEFLEKSGI
jgi:DNA-binding CsgD family transcriptional regulator